MLFDHAQVRRIEEMRFQAALQGVELKGGEKRKGSDDLPREGKGKFDGCVWGKPETYAHLTKDELKEWTDELISGTKRTLGLPEDKE